jgi:hypothetical protein
MPLRLRLQRQQSKHEKLPSVKSSSVFGATRAAEMAQGGQGGKGSGSNVSVEPEVPCTNIPSSIPPHLPHIPASQNLPYFFSSPPTFLPMSSNGHLSFQQLNTPMQSKQPSHPMLHFSSPFQMFQNSLQQGSQWMSDQGQSGR